MRLTRRSFLATSLGAGASVAAAGGAYRAEGPGDLHRRLDEVAAVPVLRVDGIDRPIKIASTELLRNGRSFLVRVRSTDGAEGIAVPNAMHMIHTYPIFLNRVAPFFVGKDDLRAGWSRCSGNSTATTTTTSTRGSPSGSAWRPPRFAVLDLLGKVAGEIRSATSSAG